MAEIQLTRGVNSLVDDADLEWLSQWKWSVSGSGDYAERAVVVRPRPNQKTRCIKMHRLILGAEPGQFVDHINGDGLDNRRGNLRLCTKAENSRNRRIHTGNVAGFKGVTPHHGRWRAVIKASGQRLSLGVFGTREEAARAYDAAAMVHHRGFARLNFPAEA